MGFDDAAFRAEDGARGDQLGLRVQPGSASVHLAGQRSRRGGADAPASAGSRPKRLLLQFAEEDGAESDDDAVRQITGAGSDFPGRLRTLCRAP